MTVPSLPMGYDVATHVQAGRPDCHITVRCPVGHEGARPEKRIMIKCRKVDRGLVRYAKSVRAYREAELLTRLRW